MPTDDMKKAKAEGRAEARRRMNPAPLWGRLQCLRGTSVPPLRNMQKLAGQITLDLRRFQCYKSNMMLL